MKASKLPFQLPNQPIDQMFKTTYGQVQIAAKKPAVLKLLTKNNS